MSSPFLRKKRVFEIYAHCGEDGFCCIDLCHTAKQARRVIRNVKRTWRRQVKENPMSLYRYYARGRAYARVTRRGDWEKEMRNEIY